ncbi:swr complex subunit [Massospora cicadina]|nr:swr complex subunit [Massospora cicadina]
MATGRERSSKGNNGINLKLATVSLFNPPALYTKCEKRELGILVSETEKEKARSVKYLTPICTEPEEAKYSLVRGLPPIHLNNPEKQFYPGKVRSRWVWHGFQPAVRSDQLKLFRWKNVTRPEAAPDETLEHHVRLKFPGFTDEVYAKYLEDQDWSLEETRHLFELCQSFDLRFLVVHDRFLPFKKKRTLEDLKARFYQVVNALAEIQKLDNQEAQLSFPTINFDKEKEVARKRHLESLYMRSRDAIDEEEGLVVMIRRLRNEGRSYIRKREQLLQTLNAVPLNPHAGLSARDLKASLHSSEPGSIPTVKRKRKVTRRAPATEVETELLSSDEKNSLVQVKHPEPEGEKAPPKPKLAAEPPTAGVYLRSASVAPIPSSLPESLNSFLASYRLDTLPNMPTEAVCEKFAEVQSLLLEVLKARSHLEQLGLSFSPVDGSSSDIERVDSNFTERSYERKKSNPNSDSTREKKRPHAD